MNELTAKYKRYHRQIILKEFGIKAQDKLAASHVLVIGAGGLGCAALQYLVAAGIGTIGIIDDDMVSLDNLHRQIIYSTNDLGFSKATIAKEKLQLLNPDIKIIAYCERLTNQNALAILANYDIVLDGTDNFASRYMINDACVLLNKPLVFGAVSQFEGQVAIFNNHNNAVNYRDLFPEPPFENEVLNCAEAGVIGVLPGIIGILQASETIKLITGIGKPLVDVLLTYNVLSNHMYEIVLSSNKNTHFYIPTNEAAFKQFNYEWNCSSDKNKIEINSNTFDQLIKNQNATFIDIREFGELPTIDGLDYIQIPLSKIMEENLEFKSDYLILFCQSGKRSLYAASQLSTILGPGKTIYSLQGGIVNWLNRKN